MSEIGLVRPFFAGFLFLHVGIVIPPVVVFFFCDLAGFQFCRLFLPVVEHIKHRKVGGTLDFIKPQAEFPVNLADMQTVEVF